MKIKNIIITGVAALTLASCNDFLDVEAPSAYTPDFVFSQKSEIERALNGVYAKALVGDLYGNAYQLTFNLNSDVDVTITSSGAHSHSTYARFDCDEQGGDIQKFWTAAYSLIEYCNKFIASAEGSKFYQNTDNDPEWERLCLATYLSPLRQHATVLITSSPLQIVRKSRTRSSKI